MRRKPTKKPLTPLEVAMKYWREYEKAPSSEGLKRWIDAMNKVNRSEKKDALRNE